MRWYGTSALALVILAGNASAARLQWRDAPKFEAQVGDRLEFDVAEPGRILLPSTVLTASDELVGFALTEAVIGSGGELRITLVPTAGEQSQVPAFALKDVSGVPVVRVEPLSLKVPKFEPSKEKPPELYGPLGLKFPVWFLVVLGVLALAALGTLAWWIWKKIQTSIARRREELGRAKPLTEDEAALKEFDRLTKAAFWRNGQHKKHYFGVSDALKIYFGARFGFDAQECTSDELVQRLLREGATVHLAPRVRALFEKLDLVKFTDHIPAEAEGAEILTEARALVSGTKRVQRVVPGAGGAK